jgi:hypothetical protein
VHAACFEEMAAHEEADPTEAHESELSDDGAPPTWMDPAPETRIGLGDPLLVDVIDDDDDDQFGKDVLEPPLREDRYDSEEDDAELPRHPDVDEPPDGGTAPKRRRWRCHRRGAREPDEVRDELTTQAMDYGRCVEAVAASRT